MKNLKLLISMMVLMFLPLILLAADLKVMPSLEKEGRVYLTWPVQAGAESYAILAQGQEIGQAKDNFFAAELGAKASVEYTIKALQGGQTIKEMKATAKLVALKNKKSPLKIKILGNTFFVDNAQFYPCGWTGQFPNNRDYNELEKIFQEIKEANYNVIIDDGSLDEYAAELAGKAGLLVLKQLSVPAGLNYADQQGADQALAQVKAAAQSWSMHGNLLGYSLANRPEVRQVVLSGLGPANEFFRKAAKAVHELDARPVTIISAVAGDLLGTDMQEFVTVWYDPADKNQTGMMTLRGYLSWLKRYKANDKPLVVIYPAATAGDTLNFFQEVLSERVNGFGLYQDKYAKTATRDLGSIFAVFAVYPCNGYKISGPIGPMVFTAKKPASVKMSIQDKAWVPLFNMWNWWRAEFETKLISDGEYNFQVQFGEKKMTELNQKITVLVQNKTKLPQQALDIVPNKRAFKPGEELYLKVKLSVDGKPAEKTSLIYGVYAIYGNRETVVIAENNTIETDKDGNAEIDLNVPEVKADCFLSLVVAADSLLAPGQKLAERRMVQVSQAVK
jgi:hypothetical protein